jgi:hypothetical protein
VSAGVKTVAHLPTVSGVRRRRQQSGARVRKLIDCLIAAVAIRADVPVLHADADFDALARYTPLQVDRPTSAQSSKGCQEYRPQSRPAVLPR